MSRAAAVLLAVAGVAAVPARAEVSVDAGGHHVFFQARPGETWTKFREGVPSSRLLNPFGDARGDSAPAIAVNPVTDLAEVAWGSAGASPGVHLGAWDPTLETWHVLDVPALTGVSPLAGRTVQLVHDGNGNRFVGYEDAQAGKILLASGPRDAHLLNRPLLLSPPGTMSSSPTMVWDGRALLVGFARWDVIPGVQVVEIVPDVDGEGRIPNGGEGVPGIPEPVFQHASGIAGARSVSGVVSGLPEFPLPPRFRPLPLVRLELLPAERVLLTWIDEYQLKWSVRIAGEWTPVASIDLPDPVEHDAARADVRRTLQGRSRAR